MHVHIYVLLLRPISIGKRQTLSKPVKAATPAGFA
jgi:hypothetical protein